MNESMHTALMKLRLSGLCDLSFTLPPVPRLSSTRSDQTAQAYEYLLAENRAQPQQDESSTEHPLPAVSAPSAPSSATGHTRPAGAKRF